MEMNLLDRYPRSRRPIDERAAAITDAHRLVARTFGQEYFDGPRLFGYGGYTYHPRFWTDTVRRIREHYQLDEDAAILDVGCGKGFMMYDWKRYLPRATVLGLDISSYAYEHALKDMQPFITVGSARELPFPDQSFDLVLSINTIHNLPLEECKLALREIQRVTRRHAFVVVDAYRTREEHERLLKWNLTALTYMHADEWRALFFEVGYRGDYFWFIAE